MQGLKEELSTKQLVIGELEKQLQDQKFLIDTMSAQKKQMVDEPPGYAFDSKIQALEKQLTDQDSTLEQYKATISQLRVKVSQKDEALLEHTTRFAKLQQRMSRIEATHAEKLRSALDE